MSKINLNEMMSDTKVESNPYLVRSDMSPKLWDEGYTAALNDLQGKVDGPMDLNEKIQLCRDHRSRFGAANILESHCVFGQSSDQGGYCER